MPFRSAHVVTSPIGLSERKYAFRSTAHGTTTRLPDATLATMSSKLFMNSPQFVRSDVFEAEPPSTHPSPQPQEQEAA